MRSVFAALLAGGAAYLLTREPVVGLLVAAGVWLFARPKRARLDVHPGQPLRTPPVRHDARPGGIEVVCKQVTAERQEWVSVRTGRLYDVTSANGPADAQPGSRAYVVPTASGYRIAEKRTEP